MLLVNVMCGQDKELGRGTYGRVIEATHRGTGRKFACKVVNITRMEPRQVSKLYSEVSVLRELDHPHIVRMREVFFSKVRAITNETAVYYSCLVEGSIRQGASWVCFPGPTT